MIKFLWYTYFVIYLVIASISRIKLFFLRKKDNKAADLYAYKRIQTISKHILNKSKTRVEVIGKENIPEGACVFISNHQAIFDAFVLISNLDHPSGFIAKKEIKKLPLIGGWLKENHTLFLDRSNVKEGIKVINEGVENVKNGYSMIIFPEGTRSLGGEMKEFKKGSLKLALKSSAPIVPISINGTYRVLEVGKKVRGHKVTIMFHKPIYTDKLDKEAQKDITDTVHSIISEGYQQLLKIDEERVVNRIL